MKVIHSTLIAAILGGLLVSANAQEQKPMNDPFYNDFVKLQKDMDSMFVNFHQKYFSDDKFFSQMKISAKSDFKDDGKKYVIKMDLPGFEKSNIDVKAKDGIINIKAKNDMDTQKKDEHFYERERYTGSVYRSFSLPKNADTSKLKTDYKNGVLTIDIPKT
ncbi:Hsp20/alpha crystallin family protein [Sulfurimonas sp. HSL-1716]|uniref:Hsp20/alpha crystallin family protein n=1 Tax=Hydrocurvibacter sulfurireducens TaxID=3131937 RepID=UPI0031F8A318